MVEATAVDPKTRTVTTREGDSYQGDFLVLAAGSREFFRYARSEGKRFSALRPRRCPTAALADPDRIRGRGLQPKLLERGALNFVIVGGGATGTEMAGALADMVHISMGDGIPRSGGEARTRLSGGPWAPTSSAVFREGPRLMPPRLSARREWTYG